MCPLCPFGPLSLPGTLAVKLAYSADFGKSLATYVISCILTFIVVVIAAVALVVLLGGAAQATP